MLAHELKCVMIFTQPFFSTRIIRLIICYQIPKLPRVIHKFQMANFVHNNVIDHKQRSTNQAPIEIQIALGRTTAPSGFLIFKLYILWMQTDLMSPNCQPLTKNFFGLLSIKTHQLWPVNLEIVFGPLIPIFFWDVHVQIRRMHRKENFV